MSGSTKVKAKAGKQQATGGRKQSNNLAIDLNQLSLNSDGSSLTNQSTPTSKKSVKKGTGSRLPVSNGRLNRSRNGSKQSLNNNGGGPLVPSTVSSVHNSHLASCPNIRPSQAATPNSESSSSTRTLANVKKKKVTSSTPVERFRFEEYMPLCEVQKLLAKGQVVEVSNSL
jgi:hypothetical protein